MEREKLRTHLQFSTRGRAVFSPYRKEISSNELFIQLLNMISDEKVKYSEFIFELPEISEIVEFLDNKCTEIDKLIANKEKIVEELEQYKKSVIYEYVTGKKEVK